MKKWMVIAACVVVASIATWATFFRASEEDRVKQTLARLVSAVMVKEGDNVITRTARIRRELADVVDDGVRVDVPALHVSSTGRAAVVEKSAQVGLMFTSAECALTNMKIQIDEEKTTAKVDALAVFTGVRGGERRIDRRDVHFLLRKDDQWRVTTIDVRPPD